MAILATRMGKNIVQDRHWQTLQRLSSPAIAWRAQLAWTLTRRVTKTTEQYWQRDCSNSAMLLRRWTVWGLVMAHHQKGIGIFSMIIIVAVIIPRSNSITIIIIAIVINVKHPGVTIKFTGQMKADMWQKPLHLTAVVGPTIWSHIRDWTIFIKKTNKRLLSIT